LVISNIKEDKVIFMKNINLRLLGLIGSILLIISEFLPWFSGQSLLDTYIFTTMVALEESFLFLFPLISGIICLIGSFIVFYDLDYKINSAIVNFIGLGFLLLFFFDIIPTEIFYLSSLGVGFYCCIAGFLIILINILIILLIKE
jgi:hypothetical protein